MIGNGQNRISNRRNDILDQHNKIGEYSIKNTRYYHKKIITDAMRPIGSTFIKILET